MSIVRVVQAVEQFVLVAQVDLAVHLVPVANSNSTVPADLVVLADLVVQAALVAIAIFHVDLFVRAVLVAIPTFLAVRPALVANSSCPFVAFVLTVAFFSRKLFLCFVQIDL